MSKKKRLPPAWSELMFINTARKKIAQIPKFKFLYVSKSSLVILIFLHQRQTLFCIRCEILHLKKKKVFSLKNTLLIVCVTVTFTYIYVHWLLFHHPTYILSFFSSRLILNDCTRRRVRTHKYLTKLQKTIDGFSPISIDLSSALEIIRFVQTWW